MITAGIGWVAGTQCGSVRRNIQKDFRDFKSLYHDLETEGVFTQPAEKIRWINTISNRYCFAAAMALRDSVSKAEDIRSLSPDMALLGISRDGALNPNLEYFRDYVRSGRKLARGNLFIHTLPTSTLAETAIAFGFKGPVLHVSASVPDLNLLLERGESLVQSSRSAGMLCFMADEKSVICFFLQSVFSEGIFSAEELKKLAGVLQNNDKIFKALKIPASGEAQLKL